MQLHINFKEKNEFKSINYQETQNLFHTMVMGYNPIEKGAVQVMMEAKMAKQMLKKNCCTIPNIYNMYQNLVHTEINVLLSFQNTNLLTFQYVPILQQSSSN